MSLTAPYHHTEELLSREKPARWPHVREQMSTIHIDQAERIWLPHMDIHRYLHEALSVSRLNEIHRHLWWAGRPAPARPLHRQRMLQRDIVVTEQADLHLVWIGTRIFIKPLPMFLLSHEFWRTYLCDDRQLHENALGLLVSFVWLVRSESDLKIAKDTGLLPDDVPWNEWRRFVETLFRHINLNTLEQVNRRYLYGELRLNRLNQIYRFAPHFHGRHLIRGYLSGYSSYGAFFRTKFAWLLIVFAFCSLMLSALQVGLATDRLDRNVRFQGASFGFVALSTIVPITIVVLMACLYAVLFLFHLFVTLDYERGKKRKRELWAERTRKDPCP